MERIPEPELMDDPDQALAHAMADFSEPDSQFMRLLVEEFGSDVKGFILSSCLYPLQGLSGLWHL